MANVMPFGLYLLRGVVIFVVTELDDEEGCEGDTTGAYLLSMIRTYAV